MVIGGVGVMMNFPTTPANLTRYPNLGVGLGEWMYRSSDDVWIRQPLSNWAKLLAKGTTTTDVRCKLADPDGLYGFNSYRLIVGNIKPVSAPTWLMLRFSYDNGVTFPSASSNYASNYIYSTPSVVPTRGNSSGDANLTRGIYMGSYTAGQDGHSLIIDIQGGAASQVIQVQTDNAQGTLARAIIEGWGIYSAMGTPTHVGVFGQVGNAAGAVNLNADFQLWGY